MPLLSPCHTPQKITTTPHPSPAPDLPPTHPPPALGRPPSCSLTRRAGKMNQPLRAEDPTAGVWSPLITRLEPSIQVGNWGRVSGGAAPFLGASCPPAPQALQPGVETVKCGAGWGGVPHTKQGRTQRQPPRRLPASPALVWGQGAPCVGCPPRDQLRGRHLLGECLLSQVFGCVPPKGALYAADLGLKPVIL